MSSTTRVIGVFTFLLLIACWSAPALAVDYPVVETGQTKCYDDSVTMTPFPRAGKAFHGQDAQFDNRLFAFQDNGDGTITDLNTGLMWQQTPSSQSFDWQQAVGHCDNLVLAGHSDWRIPSAKELFSISDFSQGWPYLNTTYFDIAGSSVSKDEQYWVSDYYAGTTHGGAPSAFGVNHGTGHIKAYPAGGGGPMGNYVRAVRGGSYGANVLVDNGDGTVTDSATGLMWQQDDSGVGLDWETALSYAENLSVGGHGDWRLPTVKELQSIVDYSRAPNATNPADVGPAIDTSFFSCTALATGTTVTEPDYGYYWSSTSAYFNPMSPGYYYGWYVAFGTAVGPTGEDTHGAGAVRFDTKVVGGPSGEDPERIFNFVRCVRGGLINPVVPDVKANGSDGPLTVSSTDTVSLTVGLDQGDFAGLDADWWLFVDASFGHASFVYPSGWAFGMRRCAAMPITPFGSFRLYGGLLPAGDFKVYFALDGNMDGELDGKWFDSVTIHVQ